MAAGLLEVGEGIRAMLWKVAETMELSRPLG